MDLHITLVGLNHRTASVDIRERYALAERTSPATWAFPCQSGLNESFILSTCNRVEVLGIGNTDPTRLLLEQWARTCGSPVTDLENYVYNHQGLDAIRHVFSVAGSLDSMVLGEPQILGQMKSAYRNAVNSHCAGAIINRLMHKAFSVAKRIRTETAVASSAVSISYAAVELAKRIFGNMPSHCAMLIGAGEMAELAAMHLLHAGIDEIIVLNRTFAHGQALAQRFHGRALPFEHLESSLQDVDIVIASTGSREPIVRARHIEQALRVRKNKPMFFIDIAVPRDIDPEINNLDNVYLYDIDDLKDVVEENMANRQDEARRAMLIVEEEARNFARWLKNLDIQPTIVEIIKRGEQIARTELERTIKRLGPLKAEQRDALEVMLGAMVKKLNHAPIMYLKKEGMARDDPHARIDTIRRVFNLDSPTARRKQ